MHLSSEHASLSVITELKAFELEDVLVSLQTHQHLLFSSFVSFSCSSLPCGLSSHLRDDPVSSAHYIMEIIVGEVSEGLSFTFLLI